MRKVTSILVIRPHRGIGSSVGKVNKTMKEWYKQFVISSCFGWFGDTDGAKITLCLVLHSSSPLFLLRYPALCDSVRQLTGSLANVGSLYY